MSEGRGLRLSGRTLSRLASVPIGVGAGAVLAVAGWLTPDGSGHSTHTQLGLDGCTVLSLTGVPCPMCGMTTSFSLMAELRILEALYVQPFGVVLFLGTLLVFGVAMAELAAPRDRWRRIWRRLLRREGLYTTAFLLCLGLGWAWKFGVMRGWF
ncbi:MAG: DUF2752 domain-containing protein [Myxococcota bacterium]